MRKLDFFRYNSETEQEEELFSLILEGGKLQASNEDGEEYLSNLEELYDLGLGTQDAKLYAQGKYEEMFDFLIRACRTPDFYVRSQLPPSSEGGL